MKMEKNDNSGGFETRAVHIGHDYVAGTGAVIPPVYMTSTFEYGNEGGFDYTRSGNPNFRMLERTLASLEGGAAWHGVWQRCGGDHRGGFDLEVG